jgi:RNA polymerase sigma-70 factor (ECF subfamily)
MGDSSGLEPHVPSGALTIETLVCEHYEMIYRYAFRMTGTAADAEDITQQAFLTAQRKLDQLRDQSAARSWMCRILRTTFLKSRKKKRPFSAADADLDWSSVPGKAAEESPYDHEQLQAMLNTMPDVFRVALLMFYFEEKSYDEIATSLDIPVGTVMSRLSRAKNHLRKRLWPVEASKHSSR